MFSFKSLQQRLAVLLILPVALFLIGAGVFGYISIRKALLAEWQSVAVLRLERAAHQMDMRLSQPKHWMELFDQTIAKPHREEVRDWILSQLRKQEGVSQVRLTWRGAGPGAKGTPQAENALFQQVKSVSPPGYFYPPGHDTVGLKSDLLDSQDRTLGEFEVILKLDYLMADVVTSGWLQANMACLVSNQGLYLAHSNPSMAARHCLGDTQDPVELAMLRLLKEKPYGTLLGPGLTPERVVGFYHLHQAPWAIMLHARGSQILAPILRFRFYYLLGVLLCLAVILILMRLSIGPLVASVRRIAGRAASVAQGQYGQPLPVRTRDEIGQLTASFNEMVEGLKERDFISNTFGRYVDKEIARELLRRPEAARLGGEKRQVVILFSDIRGFTPLAETLTPEATIHLVNRHFSQMIDILQQHHGIIVDFLGDAILAFFDPLDGPLAPTVRRALRCGLNMEAAVARENTGESKYPRLQVGIGLHAGEVVVGNVGSESRAKYGIVGAAVNLTHRIQAQAKGGEVVISDAAYQQIPEEIVIKRAFRATLKGIHEPTDLYVVEKLVVSP
ncbi:MAG: adenylate/guanylate cyclase domain-containing protein [Syntrophobacterales bacterium]|jgi:class 3 adenylate cyclase|nr:adenylate/guanylate cyclase domain-containing protein [Syntrophobacterales bacterium]